MANFDLTASKTDDLKGTSNDDTFTITVPAGGGLGDLAATDKVAGGDGTDQLLVKGDNPTGKLTDAQFSGVSSVEVLTLQVTAFNAVLGAKAGAAGLTLVDGRNSYDSLVIDASAYSSANAIKTGVGITIIVGDEGHNTLTGSKFDDTFKLNASDLPVTIAGGAGSDALEMLFDNFAVDDSGFQNISNVERVVLTGNDVTLTLGANAGKTGITLVDGSAITGVADGLTIDASGYSNKAGTGITLVGSDSDIITFTGSAFADTFRFGDADINAAQPIISGNGGADTLQIVGGGTLVKDDAYLNVTGVSRLLVTGDNGQVQVGANAAAAGINLVEGQTDSDQLVVDASGYTHDGLTIKLDDTEHNEITGSDYSDVFQVKAGTLDADDTISGGGDSGGLGDVLQITGDGKTAITVADAALAGISGVETLRPTNAKDASISLGANSEAGGLYAVDGSAVTGTFKVDASARLQGVEIVAGTNTATLTGGAGNDSFLFTSAALTSADKVDGGAGSGDAVVIIDKAAVKDSALAGLKNVEVLVAGVGPAPAADYSGASITLTGTSVALKINTVENQTGYGLKVDASGRGTSGITFTSDGGNDTLIGSTGNDTFSAGVGDDSYSVKLASFDGKDVFAGGAGNDTLRILDSYDAKNPATKITDSDFQGVSSVENLVFDATGKQDVTLDANAEAAGLRVIDGSKVTGGLTLSAGGITEATVYAGTGVDSITVGDSSSVYIASSKLTKDDTLNGTASSTLHFTDKVALTDAFFAPFASKVSGFSTLVLDGKDAGQSLVFGANFNAFVGNAGAGLTAITASSQLATTAFKFDLSAFTGFGMTVTGSGGNDTFIASQTRAVAMNGGAGDDLFQFSSIALANGSKVDGGGGNDTLLVTDDSTVIAEAFLHSISSVETLRFAAAKSGSYTVGLDGTAAVGLQIIDGSAAGVDIRIADGGSGVGHTVLASSGATTFYGDTGDDTLRIDAKSFNNADQFHGGSGLDTLVFTTAGSIAASAFMDGAKTTVDQVEFIQLSDAGNSIAINAMTVIASDGGATIDFGGGQYTDATFMVLGGKGADTVDLSGVTSGHVGVLAGAGKDTLTGSARADDFLFAKAGDLDAGDKIDGGAGHDRVILAAGSYTSDLFKGFKNIEEVDVLGGDGQPGSTITLKNDFFANAVADPNHAGAKLIEIALLTGNAPGTVDASAVTGSLNNVDITVSGGVQTLIGGAGNDTFRIAVSDAADDTVIGGSGLDSLVLNNTTGGSQVFGASELAGVSGVERLVLDGNSSGAVKLELGAAATPAGITTVDASAFAQHFSLDMTGYDGPGLTILANSSGVRTISLGAGDNTLIFYSAGQIDTNNDVIHGGADTDTLVFRGPTSITDITFSQIYDFDVLQVRGAGASVTLGVLAALNPQFKEVDASQAAGGVTVDLSAYTFSTTVLGSSYGDTITGGAEAEVIHGGLGADQIAGGGGADVFVYNTAADSRLEAGGGTARMDVISDFQSGDKLDFSGLVEAPAHVFVDSSKVFLSADTADFFKNQAGGDATGQVVIQTDDTNTRIYVDVDGNGSFDIDNDLVIEVAKDQTAVITDASLTSGHGALGADPVQPVADGLSFKSLAAGNYTDADFAGISENAVKLSSAKGDYVFNQLGAGSETNGIRLFDGSAVTGSLTIDASGRVDPVYIVAGQGANNLHGTQADDIFYFTSAGLAGDTVNGDGLPDRDTVMITDKAALLDAALVNLSSIEILEFGASPVSATVDVTGQKATLGAKSVAAGIDTVINDWSTGLTLDVSARSVAITFKGGAGDDVFQNSNTASVRDVFEGGGGNDSFLTKIAAFTGTGKDTFAGGVGIDALHVTDSYKTAADKITDDAFANFTSVEKLVFDAAGKQDVTLGKNAEAANLLTIDGSKTAGLTLDATAVDTKALTVIAGTGNDKITFGDGGGEIQVVSTKFTKDDAFDGGTNGVSLGFTDVVKLTDAYFASLGKAATHLNALELLNGGSGQSLTLGANFANFVQNTGLDGIDATDAGALTADFSAYKGQGISFNSGAGKDVIILDDGTHLSDVDAGGGDDVIKVTGDALANLSYGIEGGAGNDTLLVTAPTAFLLQAGDIAGISGVETLQLAAAKSGTYGFTLGSSDISKVDGSAAGINVAVDGQGESHALTIIAGSKGNVFIGGTGDDTFIFDPKTYGGGLASAGGDFVTGNTGIDTLQFSGAGAVSAAALDQVAGIELLKLSDAGNAVTIAASLFTQSDNGVDVNVDGAFYGNYGLVIQGGKGKDTVDLSGELGSDGYAVIAGGGSDTLIGGAAIDTFIFDGDFDKTDTVKGGGGFDVLVLSGGSYTADAFKSVASIEAIEIVEHGKNAASIALDNTFFKAGTPDGEGIVNLSIHFDTDNGVAQAVNLSAVTLTQTSADITFGDGPISFQGGAESDTVRIGDDGLGQFLLTKDTVLAGGEGSNTLRLTTDAGTVLNDQDFTHTSGFQTLEFAGGGATHLDIALGHEAAAAGLTKIDARDMSGGFNLDVSDFGGALVVYAGQSGGDQYILNGGDDVLVFDANAGSLLDGDMIYGSGFLGGGTGQSVLRFLGNTTLIDADFGNVDAQSISKLELQQGTFDLSLGNYAGNAGFKIIDASQASKLSLTTNSNYEYDVTGSAGDDSFTFLGGGVHKIIGGSGADSFTGGSNLDWAIYQHGSESTLLAGGDVSHMDTLTNFTSSDIIDLSAFIGQNGLTGAGGVKTNHAAVSDLSAIDPSGFFSAAGNVEVVAGSGALAGDTYVFADVDHNGNLDLGTDLVVKVVGTSVADAASAVYFSAV
jgi:Ca2+-binding RTX toxin-like protein